MAKFCTNCGARLQEDSRFCEECGTPVAQPVQSAYYVPPTAYAPPAYEPPVSAPEPFVEPEYVQSEPAPATFTPPAYTPPAYTPPVPPAPVQSLFQRAQTMTEAAGIAISRNPEGYWAYWDSPDTPTDNPRTLLRFAGKEDKRLSKVKDNEGVLYYVVSAAGSVGHVYADEMNDGRPVLEWVFFAPGEGENNLPSSPEAL